MIEILKRMLRYLQEDITSDSLEDDGFGATVYITTARRAHRILENFDSGETTDAAMAYLKLCRESGCAGLAYVAAV